MKDNGLRARKMDLDCIYLQTEMYTRVNFKMEIGKAKDHILGLTRAIIKDNGLLIK
jgi:hypothetical protein